VVTVPSISVAQTLRAALAGATPFLRKGFRLPDLQLLPQASPHGCAYLIDDAAGQHDCGALRRPCSPYCAHHHGICYLAHGSRRETLLLRRFEYLADKSNQRGRSVP
jgi:hypothetical protein